jgi:hypothetical protein
MTPSIQFTRRLILTALISLAALMIAVPTSEAKLLALPLVTDHSAGQNAISESIQSMPLVTDHSAGQAGVGTESAVPNYGPLDPGFLIVMRESAHQTNSVPLITDHSAGQNGSGRPVASASRLVGAKASGFDWRAVIGVGAILGLVLVAVGTRRLVFRRRRVLSHAS